MTMSSLLNRLRNCKRSWSSGCLAWNEKDYGSTWTKLMSWYPAGTCVLVCSRIFSASCVSLVSAQTLCSVTILPVGSTRDTSSATKVIARYTRERGLPEANSGLSTSNLLLSKRYSGGISGILKPDLTFRCKLCTGLNRQVDGWPITKVTVGIEDLQEEPSLHYIGSCLSPDGGCKRSFPFTPRGRVSISSVKHTMLHVNVPCSLQAKPGPQPPSDLHCLPSCYAWEYGTKRRKDNQLQSLEPPCRISMMMMMMMMNVDDDDLMRETIATDSKPSISIWFVKICNYQWRSTLLVC